MTDWREEKKKRQRMLQKEGSCAACGRFQENFSASIHRDGFGVGPEVPLCDDCGLEETPTCEELWDSIAARCAAELR